MEFTIEPVTRAEDAAAMLRIRRLVFEEEMGVALPRLDVFFDSSALHLLARLESRGEPVGALSVIETSSDQSLHESCGLKFDPGTRVARYTQLAVMKPYRGMSIPLMMVLDAHRRFVLPGGYDHTWLLFDAKRARSSFLCKSLSFTPRGAAFLSEYGRSCSLVRDERASVSRQAIETATKQIAEIQQLYSLSEKPLVLQARGA